MLHTSMALKDKIRWILINPALNPTIIRINWINWALIQSEKCLPWHP
jgi:hypothetical protein